jgi:hypothetical protein
VKDCTLTKLYNALNVLKGVETIKVKPDAAAFAPSLVELHTTLDSAVCDAYGWPHNILTNDAEILRRLLELNLQRAAPTNPAPPVFIPLPHHLLSPFKPDSNLTFALICSIIG